MGEWNWVHSCA